MKHLYEGEFSTSQIASIKKNIRKRIFYLLLYVDPQTCEQYKDVNVVQSIESLLSLLGGMNDLLLQPPEIVITMSLLISALKEYTSDNYSFQVYRKRILDAGAEFGKIKEV